MPIMVAITDCHVVSAETFRREASTYEYDSALRVIREGIEDFGAGEDVKADEHDVVQKQHDGRELVRNLALAESIIAEIADVLDLGILHDELPHGD